VAVLLALAAGCWALYVATQGAPEFYAASLQADPQAQAEASDKLLTEATELVNRAQREGPWEGLFTEEQINGWLAVDLAENHASSLPEGVEDPRADITPDGLTLACRWYGPPVDTVLSLEAGVHVADANVLVIHFRRARAGNVPLPLGQALSALTEAAARLQWGVE
jgi:hypothetical protein